MKICKRCNNKIELKDFSKDKRTKDGYRSQCKDCESTLRKQRRLKKGVRIHVNRRNDKEGFKTCSKCEIEKPYNRFDKSTVTKDKLTGKCKDCIREYAMNAYKNPIRRAAILCTQYRKIDSKKAIVNDLTPEFLFKNIVTKPCSYCGDIIDNIGCDRIDNNKGHLQNNVIPCCNTCNWVRSNKFSKEEMLELGTIIKNIKQNRILNGKRNFQNCVL